MFNKNMHVKNVVTNLKASVWHSCSCHRWTTCCSVGMNIGTTEHEVVVGNSFSLNTKATCKLWKQCIASAIAEFESRFWEEMVKKIAYKVYII